MERAGFPLLGGVREEGEGEQGFLYWEGLGKREWGSRVSSTWGRQWGSRVSSTWGRQSGNRVSSTPGLYTIHSDGAGFPLLVKLIQAEGVGECRSRVPLPEGGGT